MGDIAHNTLRAQPSSDEIWAGFIPMGRNAVGYLTESMRGAGSLQAQRIQILRSMDVEKKK